MQLRTYTGLWNVEKRLYKFYDVNLPYPVSIRQIGVLMGTGLPWLLFVNFLGVPFEPPFGHLIWLAPPAALTWWSNRPVAEGKTLVDFSASQARFFLTAKTFAALRPSPAVPRRVWLRGSAWRALSSKR